MDPYRLAEYFAWFVERGKTHEEIAKLHNIDRTTVTKVLSLRNIKNENREKLAKVPRVTMSHLEPIAVLKPELQHRVVAELVKNHKREPPTVREIENRVRWAKQQERRKIEEKRKAEELRRAVEKAKFPKCPRCNKPARSISFVGLPLVQCENYHEWSLLEGVRRRQRHGASGEPTIPQSIKSERTLTEFTVAFRKIVSEVLERIDANGIENINLDGKTKDGKEVSLDFSGSLDNEWWASLSLVLDKREIDLSVSDCKIKDHPKIKTRIKTIEYIDSKQKLAKLERQVSELFGKYGGDK
jgi:hypothetical protein